ncbi:MAG: hypothetical protein ACREQD_14515, partial [Candidatus Binataceae bacterium]
MTPFDASLAVFCTLGIAALGIHLSLYGSHRLLEERLADLAVKIRAADGALEDSAASDANFGRTIFRWAVARIPAPSAATPAGERLLQTLVHAGYAGANVARDFRALRLLGVAGLGASAVVGALVQGGGAERIMLAGAAGAALG